MKRRELLERVEQILWEHWDPIGVNDCEHAAGEYDSYAPSVVELLLDGRDVPSIGKHLLNLEKTAIELPGNPERCEFVAKLVKTLIGTKGSD